MSHSVAQGDQRQFSDWPVTVVSLYFAALISVRLPGVKLELLLKTNLCC